MVGAVTMANLAPNEEAAGAILSNAHGVIRTLLSVAGVGATNGAVKEKKRAAR